MKLLRRSALLFFGFLLNNLVSPLETVFHLPITPVREVFADVLASASEVLRRNFPQATAFEKEMRELNEEQIRTIEREAKLTLRRDIDSHFIFYVAKAEGRTLGYAVEDFVPGKWGPINYLLSLDSGGVVSDVTVLEYREKRGRPVAQKRFTKQFIGKKADDALTLQKDIQGVTGASISSKGMTNGIRKLIHVFKLFY